MNHMRWWMVVAIVTVALAEAAFQTRFIEQPQDHFHPSPTFQQRYYSLRPPPHRPFPQTPWFLYLDGNGLNANTNPDVLVNLANSYGAQLFALEHRFFGQSMPSKNLSTATLQKLMTIEQAIEDAAAFIKAQDAQWKMRENRVWMVFGAGYAGSLAVWLRVAHPELVEFAVASTPPLALSYDLGRAPSVDPWLDKPLDGWCGLSKFASAIRSALCPPQKKLDVPEKERLESWRICSQLFTFSWGPWGQDDTWGHVRICNRLFGLNQTVPSMLATAASFARRFPVTSATSNVLLINHPNSVFFKYRLKTHRTFEEWVLSVDAEKTTRSAQRTAALSSAQAVVSLLVERRDNTYTFEGSEFSTTTPSLLTKARDAIEIVVNYIAAPLRPVHLDSILRRDPAKLSCGTWRIKLEYFHFGGMLGMHRLPSSYPSWQNFRLLVPKTMNCDVHSAPSVAACNGRHECELSVDSRDYSPLSPACHPPYYVDALYSCWPPTNNGSARVRSSGGVGDQLPNSSAEEDVKVDRDSSAAKFTATAAVLLTAMCVGGLLLFAWRQHGRRRHALDSSATRS